MLGFGTAGFLFWSAAVSLLKTGVWDFWDRGTFDGSVLCYEKKKKWMHIRTCIRTCIRDRGSILLISIICTLGMGLVNKLLYIRYSALEKAGVPLRGKKNCRQPDIHCILYGHKK